VAVAEAPVQDAGLPLGRVAARRWVRSRRGRGLLLTAVLGCAVGVPVALAFLTGSIAIPHNDAWSHSKIAEGFARDGEIRLLGWNRTALVGQVVPLGPLAASIAAQQLFVAVLAVLGLVATYAFLLARVGPGRALLGTALVGALPEFGLLATSYMSDVPAFAAVMICIATADRALRRDSVPLLCAAVAVGVWGATVREQALAAPAAVVVVAALAWRGRRRAAVVACGLVAASAFVVFEWWRRSLPYGDPLHLELSPRPAVNAAVQTALTMALFLAPAVALVARPARWGRRARIAGVTVLAVAALVTVVERGGIFLGNYLDRDGAYGEVAVGTRVVLPAAIWAGLLVVACVSAGLLAGLVVEHGMPLDRISMLLGGLLTVGTLAQAGLGQPVFTRYLLPLVPIAAVLVLGPVTESRWRLAVPVVAALFGCALALTANALSFDAARWQAAQELERSGVPATDIDAGLEWVGYHAGGPAELDGPPADVQGWYRDAFPNSRRCALVAASPVPDGVPATTFPYRRFGLLGDADLWIYRSHACR
jgi:hypothetical protein